MHTASFQIRETGQIQVGDLRVGAGNFRLDEGIASVGLWFFVRDHDDLNRVVRLRVGESADVVGYRVMVSTIEIDEAALGWVGVDVTYDDTLG
jgi:hypothetical protein